jgi:hypothetical protein
MVRLEQREVVVHLSDEGRRVLLQAGVSLPQTPGILLDVQEKDQEGLWVLLDYEDGPHLLLVRRQYILVIDAPLGATISEGPVN